MTTTHLTAATRILHRIRRELADMERAHDVMWENLGRLDVDREPGLHWEPSAYGWRLRGSMVPPSPAGAGREKT